MNPQEVFCPNIDCHARGQVGKGNIGVHSQAERRYPCHECHQTFTDTKGTLFYRLRTDAQGVMLVITLLAWGCPLKAIVKAFGFHEKTVKNWWRRSGEHCRVVHEHVIGNRQLDLQQVQADEIKGKAFGQTFWMAMAMMVPTRLWLGGAISQSVTWNSSKPWPIKSGGLRWVANCCWQSMAYPVISKLSIGHFGQLFERKASWVALT